MPGLDPEETKEVQIPPGERHTAARTTYMANYESRVRRRMCGAYFGAD